MTPYKIELTWLRDELYKITVFTKDGRVMAECKATKEQVPEKLAMYMCVGKYKV